MDSVKPKIENLEKNGDFRGGTKNMSVIFFYADFSTFSNLKSTNYSFGGCSLTIWTEKGVGKSFF